MKKSNITGFGPKITEPTEKEIEETIENVKSRYDFVIQRDDAIKFTKLANELGWWITVEKSAEKPEEITNEMAKELQISIQKTKGGNITIAEAYRQARKSLFYTIPIEKDRIRKEMNAIIEKHE
jgi:hypothetical protein